MDTIQERQIYIQYGAIVGLTVIISFLHYGTMNGQTALRILHRELYFLPIFMACFWFGRKMGLVTALLVSVLYALHVMIKCKPDNDHLSVLSQIAVFNLVSLIVGTMVDARKRRNKEMTFIRETFGKYVTREIRDEILKGRIPLGGEVKDVTVLFSDLRGFVQLVETTAPNQVLKIINIYFRQMTQAIEENGGIVLQFVGDEIEAVFGAPLPKKNHQQLAVNAALAMRRQLNRVNLKLVDQGYAPLKHGIGIHSGKVLAANIGSPDRLSYAIVGETVNTASRIQDLTKQYGTDILISRATHRALSNNKDMLMERLAAVTIKGSRKQLEIYKVNRSYCMSHEGKGDDCRNSKTNRHN